MITTVIKGGLGNQLFQYAAAYAMSKRLNQVLAMDISFFPVQTLRGYKLDRLKLEPHVLSNGKKDEIFFKLYKNKYINGIIRRSGVKYLPISQGKYLIDRAGKYTPSFFSVNSENIFLNGYFQSEKYFKEYRLELLRQFIPIYNPDKEYLEWLRKIEKTNSVAVHIRRGDFIKKDGSSFHYILDRDYYYNAISYVRKKLDDPVFYFFSDDIEWAEDKMPKDISKQYVSLRTVNPDIDEMMLMKNCKHIITANSTFSWWSAWLMEKKASIRIVPSRKYGNSELIPDEWIKL